MLKKYILFAVGIFVSNSVMAYEVDNFTDRFISVSDSNFILSQEINKRLDLAVKTLNGTNKGKSCNKKDIIKAVKDQITDENTSGTVGQIEKFAETQAGLLRNTPKSETAIYSNRTMADKIKGFMLSSVGYQSSININGNYIGIDKLGHFINEGYGYYDIYKNDPGRSGFVQVLKNGKSEEESFFGFSTTGIKSYADQVANYEGLLFWNDLYDEHNQKESSYFRCVSGEWSRVRNFNWADYVNSGWDEAINCSEYSSAEFKNAVRARLDELTKKNKQSKYKPIFTCPMSVEECNKIKNKYSKYKKYLIGPDCLHVTEASPTNIFYSSQKADTQSYNDKKINLQKTKEENAAR